MIQDDFNFDIVNFPFLDGDVPRRPFYVVYLSLNLFALPEHLRMLLTSIIVTNSLLGNPNFSDIFKRIVNRFRRAGYTLDIMRQTACQVFNPIKVESYAALFSCTAVVQASDSMTASM